MNARNAGFVSDFLAEAGKVAIIAIAVLEVAVLITSQFPTLLFELGMPWPAEFPRWVVFIAMCFGAVLWIGIAGGVWLNVKKLYRSFETMEVIVITVAAIVSFMGIFSDDLAAVAVWVNALIWVVAAFCLKF